MGTPSVERLESVLVSLQSLGKSYTKKPAVRGASFEVLKGSLYGLLGPDGAGKSTILKSIAGVQTFDEGYLHVFGVPIDSERAGEQIKGRLGFMPEGLGLNLYQELSVDENVDFFAELRLVPRAEYAAKKEQLFEITRLAEYRDRRMKHLSGGNKQKLGLVCALIHNPELLILDEPTTGVDPVSRRDFWTILSREVHERGITAIVSTAYMDEASRFDRICVFHDGAQLAEGTPSDVIGLMKGAVVSVLCPDQPAALRLLRQSFARADAMGDRLRVRVDAAPQQAIETVGAALASIEAASIQVEEPTLEDTFVFMVGAAEEGRTFEEPSAKPVVSGDDAIVAHRLTKNYDGFLAVNRVSLTVKRGQIFGLLGANGAGKTTVIKMLTGIVQPTAGHGQVAGADMRRASLEVKRRIGYVSQAYSLYQDLTVRENIILYAGIYGLNLARSRQRADWVLRFGSLQDYENARSGSLPLGLRQRLALGCALVHEPQVLFLDEPTSGVDPIGRRAIWDLLFRLSREHDVAILVTTHYMSEAEHCDQLALMHAGRIAANAKPDELKEAFRRDVGSILEVTTPQLEAAENALIDGGYDPTFYGSHLHLFVRDVATDSEAVTGLLERSHIGTHALHEVDVTMEDVFVHRIAELERATNEQGEAAA